jgi:DNA-binding NtrC family response regulator
MHLASILIVDDEPPLLRLMKAYLERLGYDVTGCLNAKEALVCVDSAPHKFSLLVADLSLPDMDGGEMALRMAELNPELKVLLCSGYPFDVESLPPGVRERAATLQKPFLPNMLAKEVEMLLQRPELS